MDDAKLEVIEMEFIETLKELMRCYKRGIITLKEYKDRIKEARERFNYKCVELGA